MLLSPRDTGTTRPGRYLVVAACKLCLHYGTVYSKRQDLLRKIHETLTISDV